MTAPRSFSAVDVIRTKRDGGRLSDDQIRWFLDAYTRGEVADEQASSLLMAIFWRGLDAGELAVWTEAMIASGERTDLSSLSRPTVDKHSTGGVGDKVSLVLVPLVAACGAAVPQLSGRGLGHTGGTLDKMEAIPGWRALLPPDEMLRVLDSVGGVICAAGPGLAPADRKLYALRDVTGTVESIPLIASSIMSKKIAEGTSALVLDVKVGTGAFMKSEADARLLAETMVRIGEDAGVRTVALLTAMDEPLGRAAGNAVEVTETLDCFAGRGPSDLVEITLALAREMLTLVGISDDPSPALTDGRAGEAFGAIVRAQGGDLSALPTSDDVRVVPAPASGYVSRVDAMAVGMAAWRLGAGRARKEDPVSPIAGVIVEAKAGERVEEGQPLFALHVDDPARVDAALDALHDAVVLAPEPPALRPLVLDRIAV
ncbi:MAG TPA: thymidine phosphorylase [Acidimicrobiales bacterium]|nr:thymidine phosphorylase [Acidimicrobiales bacterium]